MPHTASRRLHDVPLNLRLPAEVKDALAAEAARRDVTVSALTRALIGEHLNALAPPRTTRDLHRKRAATAVRSTPRKAHRADRQESANMYKPIVRTRRER